ncbi:MAG: ABC transporter permease [Planctomycetes bacterium]|nr:ABC transporter permease [Planctomycetota bacterium]
MITIRQGVRYAFRQLCRSPGFTTVAVLSLALGIGANAAIFSLINGILYKSLPVRNPQELRVINWTGRKLVGSVGSRHQFQGSFAGIPGGGFSCGSFPYPAYRDFAEQARGFSDVFAFSYRDSRTIRVEDTVSLAHVLMVSGNFFRGYGAPVLIGRPITTEDDRPDAAPVAVLTYPFWQRVYGLDPDVLGRTLTVENTSFTVIGVLPRRYVGPLAGERRTDFYVPLTMARPGLSEADWLGSYDAWWVQIMGRRAPGADEAQVQSWLEVWFAQVRNRTIVEVDGPGISLQKGGHGVLGDRPDTAQRWWPLQGVVGLVLLVACANLAGLLLVRGAARQQEMAVRAALGAGRWRLVRQSLAESTVLSLAGVGLGLVFSVWIRGALTGFVNDPSGNQHFNLQIDRNVLLFALAVGVVTTLLSGLLPALRAGNADPAAGLKEGANRGTPRLGLGKVLVTAQVGLSVIIVVVGGLLCRTLVNLYRADPGFDTENLLLVPISPYSSLTRPKNLQGFYGTLRQRIAEIPGVRSVALSNRTLFGGELWTRRISIPHRSEEEPRDSMALVVSDGYFATMGIQMLQGRDFCATDTEHSPPVAIVNEEFARAFFGGDNPLGQYVRAGEESCQIVGLCRNQKYDRLRRDAAPLLYIPHLQFPFLSLTYAIRTVLPPESLIPAVRRAVAEVDRNLPLAGITTQKLVLQESLAWERLYAALCGSLALLALGLSCLGLYGLMAYHVARRTGEMGIRKALGARAWDVAGPILREALLLAVLGVAVGIPVALALVRVILSVLEPYHPFWGPGFYTPLYGVEPYDPLTLVGAAVLMIAVASLGAWLPARRAARIDPMVALRYE